MELKGLDQLRVNMAQLTKDVQKRSGRVALRKAAKVVVTAAKLNAAKHDRAKTKTNIAANIVEQFSPRVYRRTGDLMFRVGILGGAKQYGNTKDNVRKRRVGKTYATGGTIAKPGGGPGGDTFYWRFLEFGTKARAASPERRGRRARVIRARRSSASIPAKRFMRDAIAQTQAQVIDVFTSEMNKQIDKAIRKQSRAV